jgi:hemolysin-activating ACP:hemolysin acyltransferase
MSKYTWKIASEDDFPAIYKLIINSREKWDTHAITRRVVTPIFLGQLIAAYNETGELRGFITFAFMNEQSAYHQASVGINASDWRSGAHLWLVDLFCPFGDGQKILATIRKDVADAIPQTVRYFRLKHKSIKRINL